MALGVLPTGEDLVMQPAIQLRMPTLVLTGTLAALLVFVPGPARAVIDPNDLPYDKDSQKCLNELNNKLSKVVKTQGKEICKCIKDGAKGKLSGQTIEDCTTADNKGKIGKAQAKTQKKVTTKCAGTAISLDSDAIDAPREFRPGRGDDAYLLFGHGQHRCMGSGIGRIVMTEMAMAPFSLRGLARAPGKPGTICYDGTKDVPSGYYPKHFILVFDR